MATYEFLFLAKLYESPLNRRSKKSNMSKFEVEQYLKRLFNTYNFPDLRGDIVQNYSKNYLYNKVKLLDVEYQKGNFTIIEVDPEYAQKIL